MKKRGVYQKLGLFSIIIGIFIIVVQPAVLTGAVIDISTSFSKIWFFIGFSFIIGGITITLATRLENILEKDSVSPQEFINRLGPNHENKSIIVDTSLILNYDPGEIEQILKGYDNVFIPDSVLNEIHDEHLRGIIKKHSENLEGYEKYREIARGYLEKTEKPELRKELLPYLNGEKEITSGSEIVKINKLTKRVRRIMATEKGIDLETAKKDPRHAIRKITNYLDRHCTVSEADVDVLAMALTAGRNKYHTIIAQRDIDLRQAVDLIKKKHKKIGSNLDYVEPYQQIPTAA